MLAASSLLSLTTTGAGRTRSCSGMQVHVPGTLAGRYVGKVRYGTVSSSASGQDNDANAVPLWAELYCDLGGGHDATSLAPLCMRYAAGGAGIGLAALDHLHLLIADEQTGLLCTAPSVDAGDDLRADHTDPRVRAFAAIS